MDAVNFKFTISNGVTRRVSFPTRPSWGELAAKIQSLYFIPTPERVAVSYADVDGDQVTLNSEEELRDFYATTQSNQLIKFHVSDLGVSHTTKGDDKPLPTTPQDSSARNTFGGPVPLVFEVDDEWQRLPVGGIFMPSPVGEGSAHGYVETVYSDESDTPSRGKPSNGSIEAATDLNQTWVIEDKGKDKARDLRPTVEDDVSSSESVIDDQSPTKPPIHVQVHGLRPMHSETFGPPPAMSTPVRESMPRGPPTPSDRSGLVHLPPMKAPSDSMPGEPAAVDTEFPDPPSPELEPSPHSAASLSNDIAGLLNTFSSVFVAHPELSEGLRQLLRNVSNGTYWASHRDSVHRAAEDIRRAAQEVQDAAASTARDARAAALSTAQDVQTAAVEVHRAAEEEAGRRVTEAIQNIVRVFGGTGDTTPIPSNEVPQRVRPSDARLGESAYRRGSLRRTYNRHHHRPGHDSPSPPHHPPPLRHWVNQGPPPPPPPILTSGWPGWAQPPRPGMPPPPPNMPPPPPHAMSPVSAFPPPPPGMGVGPSPLTGMSQIPPWSQFKPYGQPQNVSAVSEFGVAPPPEVSYYGASPSTRQRPRAADVKASLEAAKQNYKMEKERYRREREQRRKEKEGRRDVSTTDSSVAATSRTAETAKGSPVANADTPRPASPVRPSPAHAYPPVETQIISNARGNFPQLEMFSIRSPQSPRRHNTVTGATHPREPREAPKVETREEGPTEVMQQVVGALNDMGFMETDFPTMHEVVSSHIPADSDGARMSREVEADIVSNVLERLLSMSQAATESPRASGSRLPTNDTSSL